MRANAPYNPKAGFDRILSRLYEAESEADRNAILGELSAEEQRLERLTPGIHNLILVVSILNSKRPEGESLRQLVSQWQASGPDLEKLFAPPVVSRGQSLDEINQEIREMENARLWRQLCSSVRLDFKLANTGQSRVVVVPRPDRRQPQHVNTARWAFMLLITNPQWRRLGGPCGNPNCGRYYVMRTVRQSKYCTRKCGWATSATIATADSRRRRRGKKLKLAQQLIERWKKTRRSIPWKDWVVRAGRQYEITKNFLTIAIREGELTPP